MLAREVPKVPQTIQSIALVLSCPAELDNKTLLLKTLHTLILGHTEIKLEMSWMLSPCWLVKIMPEGTTQAAVRENSSMVLLSVNPIRPNTNLPGKIGPLVQ